MIKSSTGLDENIAAFLCYLLGWVSGLAMLLIEKESEVVRFNAMQSVVAFGALTLLSIVFGGHLVPWGLVSSLINLAGIALWILLMVKAYQGERYRLPVVGDIAEDWLKKPGARSE